MSRIFYACQGIFLSSIKGSLSDVFLNGVQSISVDNDFRLKPIKDIGRSQESPIYTGPVNQITIERVWSNLENVVNDQYSAPSTYREGYLLSPDNLGYIKSNNPATDIREYDIKLVYSSDLESVLPDTALDITTFYKSLLTEISYDFSVSGPFKENITFINSISNKEESNDIPAADLPLFLAGTRDSNLEVFTRKNFDKTNSVLPDEITDFTSLHDYKDGSQVLGITNISVGVKIDYTKISDNGIWRGADSQSQVNMWMGVKLPLDITCSFTVQAQRAFQQSILNSDKNFTDQRILLVITSIDPTTRNPQYNVVDLGNKNRLTSFSISGGDTGGGAVEYTLTYKNYNNDFSTYFRSDTNFTDTEQTTEDY